MYTIYLFRMRFIIYLNLGQTRSKYMAIMFFPVSSMIPHVQYIIQVESTGTKIKLKIQLQRKSDCRYFFHKQRCIDVQSIFTSVVPENHFIYFSLNLHHYVIFWYTSRSFSDILIIFFSHQYQCYLKGVDATLTMSKITSRCFCILTFILSHNITNYVKNNI